MAAFSAMPMYCLLLAVVIGWARFRLAVHLVGIGAPSFGFGQRILSALIAPIALLADWTVVSWAVYHFVVNDRTLAAANLSSGLLLEAVTAGILIAAFALAHVRFRRGAMGSDGHLDPHGSGQGDLA